MKFNTQSKRFAEFMVLIGAISVGAILVTMILTAWMVMTWQFTVLIVPVGLCAFVASVTALVFDSYDKKEEKKNEEKT